MVKWQHKMDIKNVTHVDNVKLRDDGQAVVILDQSLLPGRTEYVELEKPQEMHDAIGKLRVRGAPAIGICAAYCMYVLAARRGKCDNFLQELHKDGDFLKSSRPTAVNLKWAVDRILKVADSIADESWDKILETLRKEAVTIQEEDMAMCFKISEYGLSVIKEGDGILTHCNAGPLATSRYGTALGPILLAKERGINVKVFADETRPLLQGARLTAYELDKAGVDVTLICDNMASSVMSRGWIQACFVGCDRVAANGDTANKIGTSGVAILAKHYGIPFYVLGPTSTIDLECRTGADIPIELREAEEIKKMFFREPSSPESVKCYNPAFDVTDHSLITGIITENGIAYPPFEESLKRMSNVQDATFL